MAEVAKKDDTKDSSGEQYKKHLAETVGVIFLIFAVSRLLAYFNSKSTGGIAGFFTSLFDRFGISGLVASTLVLFFILSNVLSILFIIGIIYSVIKISELNEQRNKTLYPEPVIAEEKPIQNEKWQRIVTHINSDNPSDWRLAVLESDIVLDDVLDKMGYVGDTIGDKLKKAVRGEFQTLDAAWEAHKIRNAIAHEGADFALTRREAQRVINLYETVFREFGILDVEQKKTDSQAA